MLQDFPPLLPIRRPQQRHLKKISAQGSDKETSDTGSESRNANIQKNNDRQERPESLTAALLRGCNALVCLESGGMGTFPLGGPPGKAIVIAYGQA